MKKKNEKFSSFGFNLFMFLLLDDAWDSVPSFE